MNRTIFVLALAALTCAGCRAMGPYGGPGCGDACCDDGSQCGPGCSDPCGPQCNGRGGSLEQNCCLCQGGGDCACFGRYCGPQCGCNNGCGGYTGWNQGCCASGCDCLKCNDCGCIGEGYPNGVYDCSACNSPAWGCGGYRHPLGYVDGHRCYCDDGSRPPGPALHGACGGHGYCCECCCGPAAPGCCNSGDQNYNFNPGPPVAQTAYPYYTLRGPRDFLLDNPPSIGPY
jgi:hypothetical protein